jgi:ABC-type transport system involved in multi-copper enzyme maturation permease subunit
MGTALTVRELVSERAIFRHEQAVGLSTSAYLGAKIMVFGGIAVLQSAVLVAIVTMVKGGPREATVLGSPTLELFVGVAATCVASAIVGLFVSTLAKTGNQVLPLTVMTLMVQIVLAGGLIAVTGRPIDPLSWFTPARWGLAATASTTDLTVLAKDSHWKHTAAVWLFDILMLVVVSAFFAALTRWRLRLRSVR